MGVRSIRYFVYFVHSKDGSVCVFNYLVSTEVYYYSMIARAQCNDPYEFTNETNLEE
jgi:hypothetical protein